MHQWVREILILVQDMIMLMCNSINHHPQAIESTIENAGIPGIKASWVAVFGYRPEVKGKV
jgi:hypothetical protein